MKYTDPSRFSRAMPIAPLLLLVSCDVPMDGGAENPPEPVAAAADDVSVQQQAILGPNIVVDHGNCSPGVTPQQWDTFEDNILPMMMQEGRVAANSLAFRRCVEDVMQTGGFVLPDEDSKAMGPYCPPGSSTTCGTGTDKDPFWDQLTGTGLSAVEYRRFYSRRAVAESASPNNFKMRCDTAEPAASGGPGWGDDRAAEQVFRHNPVLITNATNQNGSDPVAGAGIRAGTAAIIWHELLHGQGWIHGNSNATVDPTKPHLNQVPHIVGACMRETLLKRSTNGCIPAAGMPATCPAGQLKMPSTWRSNTCTCVRDPAYAENPSVTRTWTISSNTAPTIVVDSHGQRSLMHVNGWVKIRERGAASWTDLWASGAGTELYAGGDVLAFRYPESWIYRKVAERSWEYLGNTTPNTLDMDDLGTLYQRTSSTIYRMRAGQAAGWWDVIGGTSGVLIAGGDKLYKTDPMTGNVFRFTGLPAGNSNSWQQVGSPGFWFEVDNFGTLYGISPDKQGIYRNRGGSTWEALDSSGGQRLEASNRFYAKDKNNTMVSRRFPNGVWKFVADCNHFTAGGDVFYCIRSSGTTHTVDVYEQE
jgi:hypothetical protein